MAFGFGTTFGSGTGDKIVLPFNNRGTIRSYFIQVYRNGTGGGGLGRIFDSNNGVEQTLMLHDAGNYEFQASFASGAQNGQWAYTAPATGAWHTMEADYDGSAIGNDPTMLLDAAAQTLAVDSNPASGTIDVAAIAFTLGNRNSDNARNWDGMLAEFSAYNRFLTGAERTGLNAHTISPLSLSGVLCYYDLRTNAHDWVSGLDGTITGALVQAHPFANDNRLMLLGVS